MENQYDNEYVRKQLYEINCKDKEKYSYEDYKDELDIFVNDLHKQSIISDKLRDKILTQYHNNHKLCPKCKSKAHTSTLVGYILDKEKPDQYKDLNRCTCLNCGNIHTTHDRIKE